MLGDEKEMVDGRRSVVAESKNHRVHSDHLTIVQVYSSIILECPE